MQFVDVTNDVAFRKIFGQQEKKEVLISFLNAVIRLPNDEIVVDITIMNPYQLPLLAEGKTTILDVKAKDSAGNTFIVEMQVAQNKAFHKRVLYYTSQSYSQQINDGEDYSKLFPVYFVGILNFEIGENTNYLSTHKVLNVETHEHIFSDVSFHIIELKKFKKEIHELDNIVDQWIYFIKNATDLSVIPDNINDGGLAIAYNEANRGTWSKDELEEYLKAGMKRGDEINALAFAKEKGIEEGKEIGKEIGEKNNKISVIITGYKNNISIAILSILTNLSEDEVMEILIENGIVKK
jgi:predicted transposase/invertase (TIGR01784 family)